MVFTLPPSPLVYPFSDLSGCPTIPPIAEPSLAIRPPPASTLPFTYRGCVADSLAAARSDEVLGSLLDDRGRESLSGSLWLAEFVEFAPVRNCCSAKTESGERGSSLTNVCTVARGTDLANPGGATISSGDGT